MLNLCAVILELLLCNTFKTVSFRFLRRSTGALHSLRCSRRKYRHLILVAVIKKEVQAPYIMAQEDFSHFPQLNFIHFIDWRFTQMQRELQVHTSCIKNTIDERFKNLENSISRIVTDMMKLKEGADENREDIDDLQEDARTLFDRLDKIEESLDRIEQDTKACNLIFFNVEEHRHESKGSTLQFIADLLSTLDSMGGWREEDFVRAFRIGKPRAHANTPRPILVQFSHWSDKMAVLGDTQLRDRLRQNGISVAGDLTSRQKEMVGFYRNQGKIAYFYNGKLQVREQQGAYTFPGEHRGRAHAAEPLLDNEEWPRVQHSRHERGWHSSYQPTGKAEGRHTRGHSLRHQDERVVSPSSRTRAQLQTSDDRTYCPEYRRTETRHDFKERSKDFDYSSYSQRRHDSSQKPVTPGHRSYSEVMRAPTDKRTVFVKKQNSKAETVLSTKEKQHKVNSRPNNSTAGQEPAGQETDTPLVCTNYDHNTDQSDTDRKELAEGDRQGQPEEDTDDQEDSISLTDKVEMTENDKVEDTLVDELRSEMNDHYQYGHNSPDSNQQETQTEGTQRTRDTDCDTQIFTEQDALGTSSCSNDVLEKSVPQAINASDAFLTGHAVTCNNNDSAGTQENRGEGDKSERGKARNTRPVAPRRQHPRRAASQRQTGTQQGKPTTSHRSVSQSSILDSLKRVSTNDHSKEREGTLHEKGKSSSGASGADK